MAAFDFIFQQNTTFSLKTKNLPMNVAKVAHRQDSANIQHICNICSKKAATLIFCTGCSGTQVATQCLINQRKIFSTVRYDAQPSDCIKYCAVCRPLRNGPKQSVYDVTFALMFLAEWDHLAQAFRRREFGAGDLALSRFVGELFWR